MTRKSSTIDRRTFFRGTVWSGVAISGFAAGAGQAQDISPRPATVKPLTAIETKKRFPAALPAGIEFEAFSVTLAGGTTDFYRVSGKGNGDCTLEVVSSTGRRTRAVIRTGDTPVASLSQRDAALDGPAVCGGNFWGCWAGCMLGKVGAGIWANLKTKWLSCWNSANKKRWWYQKIAAYISCICNLPYGSYAAQCVWNCY